MLQQPLVTGFRWEAFGDHTGAHEKVLWIEGRARAAVLHLKPGAEVATHTHRREAHHVWVVNGSCVFGGRPAAAGCYLFVPAGAEHGAKAGLEGCTLFYLILPAIPD